MSRQTFQDAQINEEVESTRLARLFGGLFAGLAFGLTAGLSAGVVGGLGLGLGSGLILGLIFGLAAGLFGGLAEVRETSWGQQVHDGIARWHHFRHQRFLQRQLLEEEWAGVPDGAISRARPPGNPDPTQTSLSRAEVPKEAPLSLAMSVETETSARSTPL